MKKLAQVVFLLILPALILPAMPLVFLLVDPIPIGPDVTVRGDDVMDEIMRKVDVSKRETDTVSEVVEKLKDTRLDVVCMAKNAPYGICGCYITEGSAPGEVRQAIYVSCTRIGDRR